MKPAQYRNHRPLEYLPNDFRIALKTKRLRDFEFILRRRKRRLPGIVTVSAGIALLVMSELINGGIGGALFILAAPITMFGIHFELVNRIARRYKYFVVPAASTMLLLAYAAWPQAFSVIVPKQHVTLLSRYSAGFPLNARKLTVTLGGGGRVSATYTKEKLDSAKGDSIPGSTMRIPLDFYTENNRLYVDADVFAGVNHPPIRIRRNVVSGLPHGWDGNYSNVALEIISADTIPVLQIYYVSADSIRVNGVFRAGGKLVIADGSGVSSVQGKLVLFYRATPMFKYPSWRYPNELTHGLR